MADQVPCLGRVALVVRHGYGLVDGLRAGEVDVVQLPHSLAEETRHNVRALEAVAEAADHGDMERHKDLQAYAVADYCVVDSCPDDHIDLPQAEAHKEPLAYPQERHPQVLHFEWHMPKLLGLQSARSTAPQASVQRSK